MGSKINAPWLSILRLSFDNIEGCNGHLGHLLHGLGDLDTNGRERNSRLFCYLLEHLAFGKAG